MNTDNDYTTAIIALINKFHNKALLKMNYNLAEYLYIYKDGGHKE